VVEKLALIALGRTAGFSLEEIAAMFAPDGRLRIDRQKLAAKAKELDGKIKRLTAMRDGLRHAVNCKAPSHMECPKFRRILAGAAVRAGARPRRPRWFIAADTCSCGRKLTRSAKHRDRPGSCI
jgi:hypothetical protein